MKAISNAAWVINNVWTREKRAEWAARRYDGMYRTEEFTPNGLRRLAERLAATLRETLDPPKEFRVSAEEWKAIEADHITVAGLFVQDPPPPPREGYTFRDIPVVVEP